MFGDLFQSRATYTTGLFYSGRRRYFHGGKIHPAGPLATTRAATAPVASSVPLSPPSALQPPTDFMTIRQSKDFLKIQRAGTVDFQKLEFKKTNEIEDRPGRGAQGKGQKGYVGKGGATQNLSQTITVEKYPSLAPQDWREEQQAGCTFYVHKETGEACREKPWEEVRKNRLADANMNKEQVIEEEEEAEGTGALVYDSSELSDLFQLLDQQASSKVQHQPQTCSSTTINI
jgi:hypothetical protein